MTLPAVDVIDYGLAVASVLLAVVELYRELCAPLGHVDDAWPTDAAGRFPWTTGWRRDGDGAWHPPQ